MSLKQKTISGLFWSFLQKVGSRGIALVATIVLARILTPRDFGLIGMLSIFIALSQTLVQAGFKQALIQKKNTDEEDYSSVFWINLIASILIYGILFFTAPLIAQFYDQYILIDLTRVLSLIFLINAFSYVQEAKLTKEMRFKTLMLVHLPSTIISGVVAIWMALTGFGVWSIVGQQLCMRFAYAIQLWIYSKWKPLLVFNKQKAKGLFSFGSKLLIAGSIQSIFRNIYLIIIGKFFPVAILGYYQNAKKLVDLPTLTLSGVLRSVTFPVFSSVQDNNDKLKRGFRATIEQLVFWLCPMLVIAAVLATPLFRFVLTDKWLPSVPFFQIICVVGIFYPLNSYNLNIVNVKGRSDIVLKLQVIKKIVTIIGIAVIIFMQLGIWALVIFQVANAVFSYFLNSVYSGQFIDYPIKEQLKDIIPIFLLGGFCGFIVFIINKEIILLPDYIRLIIGFLIGFSLYFLIAWKFNLRAFKESLTIAKGQLSKLIKK